MLSRPSRFLLRMASTTSATPAFTLPALPYADSALEPHISKETISFHYGKHHQAYVTNLNNFVAKMPDLVGKSLEDIIMSASGGVFNNAAQVWNHTFYWNSMKPNGGGKPSGRVGEMIERDFGSYENFRTSFVSTAVGHFASGWAWLVQDSEGKLKIVDTHDAGHPVREGKGRPLICCDVWEHAYYIDYRNDRKKSVETFLDKLVNWDFANANLQQ
jgi:Fe-Mn family superoxide dismutase